MTRAVFVIAGREIREAWSLPRFHVTAAAFVAVAGVFFALFVTSFDAQSAAARALAASHPALLDALSLDVVVVSPFLRLLALLVIVLAPLETMRTIAGERASGSLALLLSAPVPLASVVVGKFLGALALVLTPVLAALLLPLALATLAPVDLLAFTAGVGGLVLFAAAAVAAGLLASALTSSQALAAFLAVAVLMLSVAAGIVGDTLDTNAGTILAAASPLRALEPFATGVLDASAAGTLLAWTVLALLLAHRALEARRWS